MRLVAAVCGVSIVVVLGSLFADPAGMSTARSADPATLTTPSSGVIRGVVHDVNGSPSTGTTVELVRDGRVAASTKTDARGGFTFEHVAEGIYEVRALVDGLAAASLRVAVGTLPTPHLKLFIGADAARSTVPTEDAAAKRVDPQLAPPGRAAETYDQSARRTTAQGHILPYAPPPSSGSGEFNTAAYDRIDDNRFRRVSDAPLSTFSIDVDTASYSNVRRFLNEGVLPPADAVRVEELINYFRFGYGDPTGDTPFSVTTDVAPCPWNPRHRLALVGLQGRRERRERTPPRNLVFLLDVSGSMTPLTGSHS
jgi:hypothetical protein